MRLRTAHGSTTDMIRLGTLPTGIRASSLRDATSIAETESAPAFETSSAIHRG